MCALMNRLRGSCAYGVLLEISVARRFCATVYHRLTFSSYPKALQCKARLRRKNEPSTGVTSRQAPLPAVPRQHRKPEKMAHVAVAAKPDSACHDPHVIVHATIFCFHYNASYKSCLLIHLGARVCQRGTGAAVPLYHCRSTEELKLKGAARTSLLCSEDHLFVFQCRCRVPNSSKFSRRSQFYSSARLSFMVRKRLSACSRDFGGRALLANVIM
jgi:hypothetical protein